MSALSFPFLSLPLLLVAGVGFAVVRRFWPAGRIAAALMASVAATVAAGALGLTPWLSTYRVTAFASCLVVAVLVALVLARQRLRAAALGDGRTAVDLAALALGSGLVGARLLFVLQNRAPAAADGSPRPWDLATIADIDAGGMVWYGGALPAALLIIVWARWRRWPLAVTADALLPCALAALAVGRVGCFLNGCCWGTVCDVPWAVDHLAADGRLQRVHPVQLYESAVTAALAAALVGARLPVGLVTALAISGYAAWRFVAEFLRGDHHPGARLTGVDLSVSQGLSLALLVLGAVLGWWAWRHRSVTDATTAASTNVPVGGPRT